MFNIKEIISRVAHGQSPNSPARNNEPDTAEGFLCPLCMNAFGSQDELQSHYSASHKDFEPPSGTSSNNEEVNVFQTFHQGVGDRYKQAQPTNPESAEAKELFPETNSADFQLETGEMSPKSTIKELVKKLNYLIKQKDLIAEEKTQVEQRAAALAEKVVTLKAAADEEESEKAALANRLAVVEAQLAHRENIDDAAVLRQELIQVQRVMDEMTREREMESDQLKRDLKNLQQKYELLESESEKAKTMEEDMKRIEILEESILRKDELIAEINDKLTMLKETVSSLEHESFLKSSTLKETETELENSKLMLNEMRSKEECSSRRIAGLEEKLMEASLALEESKKEQKRMDELLSCLEENSRKDSETILNLKSEVTNSLNAISNKNKELMAVNEKVEILTSQLKEYTILNEDLRSRNAEQARCLEDKTKLVTSMEDKEKEIHSTLEQNVAQMDELKKNYLELAKLFQEQLMENNKLDSDAEKKLLSHIVCAVDLLTKTSNDLNKQELESLQKEGKSTSEEIIKMLQSECKEKSELLAEAQRRISIVSAEMESKANTDKAKTEEFEAIINSLKINLEQCRADLAMRNKVVEELEEKLAAQKLLVAQKEEEIDQLNSKYMKKVKDLKEVKTFCSYIKKEFVSCKEDVSTFTNDLKQYKKICEEKVMLMSMLQEQLEEKAKELPKVKENLQIANEAIENKNSVIEELMRKLDAEQKKSSGLEDINSIKLMEIEELNSHLELERNKNSQLNSEMENLLQKEREMKEHITECENKVKSLTADLLASEKCKADIESDKQILEAKMTTDLHEKEMMIEELDEAKEMLLKQNIEVKKEMEALETNFQDELKQWKDEIEHLKSNVVKEELQKEEIKKNLEEELLAKSALEKEFSLFRTRHETDVTILNDNIKSLTIELSLKEESEKVKENTIDKLQQQNSSQRTEWETERQALLERYIQSTKENERLQGATNDLRRRLEDSQAALHEIGRENQTYQMELAKLSGRKWTEDSDVTNCMKCAKEFSIRVRKHHCRNCGQIFCNDCSSKMAAIASNKKPVRVCEACYIELVPN